MIHISPLLTYRSSFSFRLDRDTDTLLSFDFHATLNNSATKIYLCVHFHAVHRFIQIDPVNLISGQHLRVGTPGILNKEPSGILGKKKAMWPIDVGRVNSQERECRHTSRLDKCRNLFQTTTCT
jgi:hypothetical protein